MKNFIKLLIRFALFSVLVLAVVGVSLGAYGREKKFFIYEDNAWENIPPYRILEEGSEYNIVLDQHSHTKYSDGVLSVRQNVLWHIAMGYNAMFLTDHNTMDNRAEVAAMKEEFKDKIVIMPGMEWSTKRVHLNFLGIDNWDFEKFPIKKKPTDAEIKAAIDEAHRLGAIVVLNHYLWYTTKDLPTRQQFFEWGIDYIEVINSDCYETEFYDEQSIAFCEEKGLGQITGTDMHRPDKINALDSIHGWTQLKVENFTEEEIMEQLRQKNTKVLYSEAGTPLLGKFPTKPGYEIVLPLIKLGKYLKAIYIGQGNVDFAAIGIVSLYAITLFLVFEGLRQGYILLTGVLDKKKKRT